MYKTLHGGDICYVAIVAPPVPVFAGDWPEFAVLSCCHYLWLPQMVLMCTYILFLVSLALQ